MWPCHKSRGDDFLSVITILLKDKRVKTSYPTSHCFRTGEKPIKLLHRDVGRQQQSSGVVWDLVLSGA